MTLAKGCARYLVNFVRAQGGSGEDLAPLHSLDNFRVLGPAVGHFTTGHDFPAEDTKGPDVRLGGEPGVVEHFWRRPLDGELGTTV